MNKKNEKSQVVAAKNTDSVNSVKNVEAPKISKEVTTVAQQIWNEIKNKKINMFSLPNQIVSNYCTPVQIEPSRCFLVVKVSSVLPALEEAIGSEYQCEAAEKYILVSRKKHVVG